VGTDRETAHGKSLGEIFRKCCIIATILKYINDPFRLLLIAAAIWYEYVRMVAAAIPSTRSLAIIVRCAGLVRVHRQQVGVRIMSQGKIDYWGTSISLRKGAAALRLGTAALGLFGLGTAFTPAAAFPYPDYYRGYSYPGYYPGAAQPITRLSREASVDTGRKRARSGKNADAAPAEPAKPLGPLTISISINNQHATLYDEASPIGTTPVSTGKPGKPTPMGVFSVIQKDRLHHSNLYSNAPMPYMQRITWSGVALHEGVLPGYAASHGCIRLPHSFAVRLWGLTKIGARVVITRNDVAPHEINHPRLAALSAKPEAPAPAPVPEARDAAPAGDAREGVLGPQNGGGSDLAPVTMARLNVTAQTASDASGPSSRATAGAEVPPAVSNLRPGPVSLFVSRKEGKLFVRKGFQPVFDMPIKITHPEQPLGTHLFTAVRPADGSTSPRWLTMSVTDERSAAAAANSGKVKAKGKGKDRSRDEVGVSADPSPRGAAESLDRIELPQEALDRIIPLIGTGASLLISDQGLGNETGKETDFIVVTR
jgi:hypothetical protein